MARGGGTLLRRPRRFCQGNKNGRSFERPFRFGYTTGLVYLVKLFGGVAPSQVNPEAVTLVTNVV